MLDGFFEPLTKYELLFWGFASYPFRNRTYALSRNKTRHGEHLTPKRTTEGYYLLSARNVKNSLIDLTDVDFVGVEEYQRIRKRCDPETGDILISCSGTIGRVTVLPSGIECVMVRSAALIKLDKAKVHCFNEKDLKPYI